MTDENLLIAIANRDESALVELSRRYAPYFRAMMRLMALYSSEIEECVQDTIVRVWETADRFDPSKASTQTWLVTTAHRLTVNRLRQRRSYRATGAAATDVVDPGQNGYIFGSEALDALDADARLLFELAFFGGYTHEEVAELTDRPAAPVATTLQRVLVRLHQYFSVTTP